jgi:prevent-host-death family protein
MRREHSVYEAKARLSALLREVRSEGHEVVITHHGEPIAKLVPLRASENESLERRIDDLVTRGLIIPAAVAPKSLSRADSPPSAGALRRFLRDRE